MWDRLPTCGECSADWTSSVWQVSDDGHPLTSPPPTTRLNFSILDSLLPDLDTSESLMEVSDGT